jgi:hypothetical protein
LLERLAIDGDINAHVERAFDAPTRWMRIVMRGLDPRIQDEACAASRYRRRLGARIKSGRDEQRARTRQFAECGRHARA